MKGGGVSICGEETEPAGDKTTSFKGPKHKFFVFSHLPWALAKGGWCRLGSPEESLEWEALGRDMEELLLGSLCGVFLCCQSSHFS